MTANFASRIVYFGLGMCVRETSLDYLIFKLRVLRRKLAFEFVWPLNSREKLWTDR